MKEINFKYFLNGEEVNGDLINWEYSTSITCKDNEIYVTYEPQDVNYIYGKPLEEDKPSSFSDLFASLVLNSAVVEMNKPTPFNQPKEENPYKLTEEETKKLTRPVIPQSLLDKLNNPIGVKHNKDKAPLSILFTQFPDALEAISRCSDYGHQKYKDTDSDFLNFKRVDGGSKTYADAGLRHRLIKGDDAESGLPHQYHVAWNALAELQLWIEENIKKSIYE